MKTISFGEAAEIFLREPADQRGEVLLGNNAYLGGGRPRAVVDFRKRPEFEEPAVDGVERHGLLVLPFGKGPLLHRLAEILAVIADIKFVILDRAVDLLVLTRKIR